MTDNLIERAKVAISLFQHNRAWKGLQDIDIEAYQKAEALTRALIREREAAEELADAIECAPSNPALSAEENERLASLVAAYRKATKETGAFQRFLPGFGGSEWGCWVNEKEIPMSDDLVKRLRKTTQCKRPRHVSKTDRLAAADRIEELEAKLEKAVEAIELARNGLNGLVDSNDAFDALNATLEELKGETDER